MLARHISALWYSFLWIFSIGLKKMFTIFQNSTWIPRANVNNALCVVLNTIQFSLLRFALTAQPIWHFICVSLWTSHNFIDSAKDDNDNTKISFVWLKSSSTGHLNAKQKMIRIFSCKFLKVSVFPSQTRCKIVRNIWTSSSVCYSKFTAQEIADRKRKDDEMRWTKFYQYPNMKYHAIVTRMKIYPTLATLFMTPVALIMEVQQMIPPNSYVACLACGKNFPFHFPFHRTIS